MRFSQGVVVRKIGQKNLLSLAKQRDVMFKIRQNYSSQFFLPPRSRRQIIYFLQIHAHESFYLELFSDCVSHSFLVRKNLSWLA